ncbi:hypothetical protein PR048_016181 [Dryococelus australis]|uniref:Uncharacterized protein n=1 Tax=Dryococelus australis TaxID=614101 RepID=A0ABQ9HJ21_9NEOP|nr:hypothetical protein PR048_016181 [Dryococelus australis]
MDATKFSQLFSMVGTYLPDLRYLLRVCVKRNVGYGGARGVGGGEESTTKLCQLLLARRCSKLPCTFIQSPSGTGTLYFPASKVVCSWLQLKLNTVHLKVEYAYSLYAHVIDRSGSSHNPKRLTADRIQKARHRRRCSGQLGRACLCVCVGSERFAIICPRSPITDCILGAEGPVHRPPDRQKSNPLTSPRGNLLKALVYSTLVDTVEHPSPTCARHMCHTGLITESQEVQTHVGVLMTLAEISKTKYGCYLSRFIDFVGGSDPAAPILADQQARPADVRREARQTHPRRSEGKQSQTANISSTSYGTVGLDFRSMCRDSRQKGSPQTPCLTAINALDTRPPRLSPRLQSSPHFTPLNVCVLQRFLIGSRCTPEAEVHARVSAKGGFGPLQYPEPPVLFFQLDTVQSYSIRSPFAYEGRAQKTISSLVYAMSSVKDVREAGLTVDLDLDDGGDGRFEGGVVGATLVPGAEVTSSQGQLQTAATRAHAVSPVLRRVLACTRTNTHIAVRLPSLADTSHTLTLQKVMRQHYVKVLRVIEVNMERRQNEEVGKWEIPEKTRQPAATYGTITTCENPMTRPGIEPGLPWWEGSVLIAQPPWPLNLRKKSLLLPAYVLTDAPNITCTVQRHDGNTARLARRNDETLGVRVSVARIAPPLLDLGRGVPTGVLGGSTVPYRGVASRKCPDLHRLCSHNAELLSNHTSNPQGLGYPRGAVLSVTGPIHLVYPIGHLWDVALRTNRTQDLELGNSREVLGSYRDSVGQRLSAVASSICGIDATGCCTSPGYRRAYTLPKDVHIAIFVLISNKKMVIG